MSASCVSRTQVGIVGGGPAGLMLSHLLSRAGIESVVIDTRTHAEIEATVRAGILERDSVRLLTESGVSDRVLTEGHEHQGIDLRFGGQSHRIDFQEEVSASVWLYPQTEIFVDLAAARQRDGGDVRFGVSNSSVIDITSDQPAMLFTDAAGVDHEVRCQVLIGADGSRSTCRQAIPENARKQFFREYPFAWFGILCDAPPSAPELIYAHSERGFALISQRTETMQRMYFQCPLGTDPSQWSEQRIWDELQARVDGEDGYTLKTGPITEAMVLPFRSFVCEPMRYGSMLLAGDAAHTVPPTGAKGLNLALADVRVLADVLTDVFTTGQRDLLDSYGPRAADRVWKAQHFSYWMTTMLHTLPEASAFDTRRQQAELATLVSSDAGRRLLAEGYTGWPQPNR